jgi:hypothetical protein
MAETSLSERWRYYRSQLGQFNAGDPEGQMNGGCGRRRHAAVLSWLI